MVSMKIVSAMAEKSIGECMSQKPLTGEELGLLLENVEYKEGWKLSVKMDGKSGRFYLQWSFLGKCCKTGEHCVQYCRKWMLSEYMTESEVIGTAFKAALTAEEHECREHFLYENKRVFNPHIDIRALLNVCDQEDVRS